MSEALFVLILASSIAYAWGCGYERGKLAGIREVRHLYDEEKRACDAFRAWVMRELGMEDE